MIDRSINRSNFQSHHTHTKRLLESSQYSNPIPIAVQGMLASRRWQRLLSASSNSASQPASRHPKQLRCPTGSTPLTAGCGPLERLRFSAVHRGEVISFPSPLFYGVHIAQGRASCPNRRDTIGPAVDDVPIWERLCGDLSTATALAQWQGRYLSPRVAATSLLRQ